MYKLIERSKKAKNRKGFTLIELIVVIIIIGILAAIIIPRFMPVTDSAKDKAVIANQREIASAVQMYMADNDGVQPLLEADLTPYLTGGAMPNDKPVGATYAFTAGSPSVVSAVSPTGNAIPNITID